MLFMIILMRRNYDQAAADILCLMVTYALNTRLPQLHMNPNHKRDWSMYKMIGSPYFYNVKSVGYYCAFCRINSNNILVRYIFMVFLLLFFCFDFRCSCFRLLPKTLTAQWNQPPWCWSVLRFISFRLGNGQRV